MLLVLLFIALSLCSEQNYVRDLHALIERHKLNRNWPLPENRDGILANVKMISFILIHNPLFRHKFSVLPRLSISKFSRTFLVSLENCALVCMINKNHHHTPA